MTIGAGELVGALLMLGGGLAGMAWWFVRQLNDAVKEERRAREAALKEERDGREEDRHALRNELVKVDGRVTQHELKVAREYVTTSDLTHALEVALRPIGDGMGRLERAVERIFQSLDGKQDKHAGG